MKLTIKGLTKNYGKVCALSQFTYEFAPGIYGILGANGAGKSTLFGLLTRYRATRLRGDLVGRC